jgi:hypothetical protein
MDTMSPDILPSQGFISDMIYISETFHTCKITSIQFFKYSVNLRQISLVFMASKPLSCSQCVAIQITSFLTLKPHILMLVWSGVVLVLVIMALYLTLHSLASYIYIYIHINPFYTADDVFKCTENDWIQCLLGFYCIFACDWFHVHCVWTSEMRYMYACNYLSIMVVGSRLFSNKLKISDKTVLCD